MFGNLEQEQVYTLSILLPLLITLAGLGFAVAVDKFFSRKQKRVFCQIILLVLLLAAQNYLELRATDLKTGDLQRTVLAIFGYCIRPVILLLFFYLVKPGGRFWPAWVLIGVNAALYMTALFSRVVFYIEDNRFHDGPLHLTCLVLSLILLAWLLWLTVQKYREHRGRDFVIPLFIVPVILGSILLDNHVGKARQPVSFLTIAIVCCCMLYYLWLHLQFIREHERDLQARQRMQIMLSQIRPHFLYNALGAIEGLCDTDPQAARAATVRFARYLRNSLSAVELENDIPFTKELEHTKLYLELEQTRFEDALKVVYEIGCTDFFLPPLTLEPLAENAVRHGVREKPDGRGTVTITTRELPDGYEISVRDDGPGFDPSVPPDDGKEHIGIANVRERLQNRGGSLTITSETGRGTVATIRIPKEGV